MDGIINLNKAVGITSAKALYRVRALTGQRKSGHAGTLDPGADGVLVLCFGRATKLVETIMDQPKAYHTVARLDVTSESFDSDRPLVAVPVAAVPDRKTVDAAFASFIGEIMQRPPAISAIKVGGRPAYKLAGKPGAPELNPRPVRVYSVVVNRYAWPIVEFDMCCGRGTYVRALIRDVGAALGTGGCLSSLTRTRVGPFDVGSSWTIDAMTSASTSDYLIPLREAIRLLDRGQAEMEGTGADATPARFGKAVHEWDSAT